ncbi:protein SRC2-like [Chenopodium quinoa]|uniref:protein SRC2-like n=1 Tax=Chenopodium quinoa TaxID=63459 RepID=UPI000B799882|nr:protein SRC2-like [Chenopodium quinoa]
MEHRPIEVKLLNAKDLKDVNIFSKMDVYVIGSVSGDPRSIQRTTVDKDGGTNPKWNHEMKFTFDESAARMNRLGLVFQIMSDRTLGDKEVGRVYVPLKELFDTFGSEVKDERSDNEMIDQEKNMLYQVQTPTGKFKGQLEFSFKFGKKYSQSVERKLDDLVIAYPAVGPSPGVMGTSIVQGYGTTPNPGPTSKSEPTSIYPSPNIGGATCHGAPQPGYPPQGYGHGYGYGCGYGYQHQYTPQPFPNPHVGYGYGFPGGYGYAGQAPTGYTPKPKKNKFGLGAVAGIGAGLLGGLLVGEMVDDVADSLAYDDSFDY